jgi:thioredoxin-dependent peroxiredoxin
MTSLIRFLGVGSIICAQLLVASTIAAAYEPAGEAGKTTEPATPSASTTKTEAVAMPEVGSTAIDFNLAASDGKQTTLKDYDGKWVVLYPKDFTSGCTIEANNFQRDQAKLKELNAVILGVSGDNAESHKDFCAKEGLTFKLLSDPETKLSTQYGSVMEYQGAKMSARNTFIISPEKKIAKVFTKVDPTKHSEEVLVALKELQKEESK